MRLPIGQFNSRGDGASTFTVAQARARALQWSSIRRESNIVDLREHLVQLEADRLQSADVDRRQRADELQQREDKDRAATLARQRRLTVCQLFDEWRKADLQPRTRADGKRTGRVDAGQYVYNQFSRHVFPVIGAMAVEDVRKADLLALLDAQKAAGKMRTANMLLADLKQMLAFAQERELIAANPIANVKKSKVGGPSVQRDRNLSEEEIRLLAPVIVAANLSVRTSAAIWLALATAVRVGELMGAVWADTLPPDPKARAVHLRALQATADAKHLKLGLVNLETRTWYLPTTKNQRDHTIHLSTFALGVLHGLANVREAQKDSPAGGQSPWIFPARDARHPVSGNSFGKQLSDRQRDPSRRLTNRTKATTALCLPGGQWKAHDLRRTAGTMMARLGFGSDVINECLNHIQSDRMARVYIQDRRQADQRRAFDALGERLSELIAEAEPVGNVIPLRIVA